MKYLVILLRIIIGIGVPILCLFLCSFIIAEKIDINAWWAFLTITITIIGALLISATCLSAFIGSPFEIPKEDSNEITGENKQ